MYPTVTLTPDDRFVDDADDAPEALDVKHKPIDRLVALLAAPW